MNMGRAVIAQMRGDPDKSYDFQNRSLSQGMMNPGVLQSNYATMGWNDMPRFVERKARYEELVNRERVKFLAIACGPDGFTTWQPSPDTCANVDSI